MASIVNSQIESYDTVLCNDARLNKEMVQDCFTGNRSNEHFEGGIIELFNSQILLDLFVSQKEDSRVF